MRRLPGWLQTFSFTLFGLALVTAATSLAQRYFGVPLPLPLALVLIFAFVLVFLGSAWMSYLSGLTVCVLTAVVLPRIIVTSRVVISNLPNNRPDTIRFGLMLAISLLVSYIGNTHRRREAELRHQAEELEARVHERSEELLLSALEKRVVEDRLRFILDSTNLAYWDTDLRTGKTVRSSQHDRLFGHDRPLVDWDYQTFLESVHPEDRERIEREYEALMTGTIRPIEYRVVWPDGSVHWLWTSAQLQTGSDGKPGHVGGITIDITSRRQAEEESREKAQLLDLAQNAILVLDLEGRIRFWSRGAEKIYGYSSEEAMGQIVHELLDTKYPESLEAAEQELAGQGSWEGELTHSRKNGAQVVVASRWALRLGAGGEKLGRLEVNTDITERRRIEEQLRHAQKLESLGVLAGGVAHDFNNLLTGILGNASLALDRIPPFHPNRILIEEAIQAAERAADLTRQLLAYAGKGRFVMRNINMSALVKEISGLVQTSIPKPVQLRLQLDDSIPTILADAGQMQQIIMNLVINAAEAIGPEGGTVLVRTGVQQVDQQYLATLSGDGELSLKPGDHVLLEVHDTGSGMDEDTRKKIFDPFFSTKFAGRGLGLSAVLGIVRAHHGGLKVYTQPGRGTTFKLLFPAGTGAPPVEAAAAVRDLSGAGTVLIVDDEEMVRRMAQHTLERYGYRTLLAANGREALDAYRREPGVAIVLLDLTMPVMSGEETLRQLQVMNPRVRVLLSSGYNEIEAVQRFTGKGLAGFIQKPYTATALAEQIKRLMMPS